MELRHANHCVYKIRYHMVFCMKYRKTVLLDAEIISFLKTICFGISESITIRFAKIADDVFFQYREVPFKSSEMRFQFFLITCFISFLLQHKNLFERTLASNQAAKIKSSVNRLSQNTS